MGAACGGGKTQTTSQQQTNTPTGMAQLGDIWDRVKSVASTPYQAFNGQLVAGLTPTQQSGIQGVTNAQGAATPYFNQAANYATQGAAPIDPSNIQRYENPFTNDVINATQANFNQNNAIQQQGVIGNAAAQGALGGDRVGVAQGEVARQQNLAQSPVLAGLRATGYSQALGAAQADRSAAAQGAYTFGALAPSVQNAQISGAQAQIGAGGLEQGTNQAGLTAAYQQYLQAQAFPYQQTGFLASAGLPAVNAMGGSSTGATTSPGPNMWAQLGGLGLGAAAAFAKDGGRIEKAGGGPLSFADIPTYVPRFSQMGGGSNPFATAPHFPSVNPTVQNPMGGLTPTGAAKAGKAIGGLFGSDDPTATTGYTGNTSSPFAGVPDATTSYMGGTAYPMFAGGGIVDLSPNDYVRQGFGDTQDAIQSGAFDPQRANAMGPLAFQTPSAPFPRPRPDEALGMAPAQESSYTAAAAPPMAAPDSGEDAELPPEATPTAGTMPYAVPGAPEGRKGLLGLNLSDEARMGLMAAGLGIAASKSPFALSAIGEGGLTGLKTYAQQKEQKLDTEREAKKLAQQASQFSQNLGLHKDTAAEAARHHGALETQAQQAFNESVRQHNLAQMQPVTLGTTKEGFDIKGVRDPASGSFRIIEPMTGRLLPPGEGLPAAGGKPTYVNPQTGQPIPQGAEAKAEGIIPTNAQLVSSGTPYDYTSDTPYIEKGMDVPKPAPVAGKSATAIQTDAEYYLQTGKLPPVARGKSPVAVQQNNYRNAVQNYAGSMAQSRGVSPEQTADMWRTAPGMLRFILGADGRSTVALGTAVRHLDTVQQLAKAWAANDIQTINRLRAVVSREFGSEAATNLDAAGRIVGPEIIKALGVAGAGTAEERNAAGAQFSTATSPAQLAGAAQTVQKLLGGQLEGRKRQAMNAGVSEERFKSLIGDRPYEMLTNADKGGAPAAQSSGDPLAKAREAISRGADKGAVIKRLKDAGIDTSGL